MLLYVLNLCDKENLNYIQVCHLIWCVCKYSVFFHVENAVNLRTLSMPRIEVLAGNVRNETSHYNFYWSLYHKEDCSCQAWWHCLSSQCSEGTVKRSMF